MYYRTIVSHHVVMGVLGSLPAATGGETGIPVVWIRKLYINHDLKLKNPSRETFLHLYLVEHDPRLPSWWFLMELYYFLIIQDRF